MRSIHVWLVPGNVPNMLLTGINGPNVKFSPEQRVHTKGDHMWTNLLVPKSVESSSSIQNITKNFRYVEWRYWTLFCWLNLAAGFPSHTPYPCSQKKGEDSSILGTVEMFGASLGASESWEFTGTSKGSCWRCQGWRWDARWKCWDFYSASTFSGVLSRWKMAMNWLGEVEILSRR